MTSNRIYGLVQSYMRRLVRGGVQAAKSDDTIYTTKQVDAAI